MNLNKVKPYVKPIVYICDGLAVRNDRKAIIDVYLCVPTSGLI